MLTHLVIIQLVFLGWNHLVLDKVGHQRIRFLPHLIDWAANSAWTTSFDPNCIWILRILLSYNCGNCLVVTIDIPLDARMLASCLVVLHYLNDFAIRRHIVWSKLEIIFWQLRLDGLQLYFFYHGHILCPDVCLIIFGLWIVALGLQDHIDFIQLVHSNHFIYEFLVCVHHLVVCEYYVALVVAESALILLIFLALWLLLFLHFLLSLNL